MRVKTACSYPNTCIPSNVLRTTCTCTMYLSWGFLDRHMYTHELSIAIPQALVPMQLYAENRQEWKPGNWKRLLMFVLYRHKRMESRNWINPQSSSEEDSRFHCRRCTVESRDGWRCPPRSEWEGTRRRFQLQTQWQCCCRRSCSDQDQSPTTVPRTCRRIENYWIESRTYYYIVSSYYF